MNKKNGIFAALATVFAVALGVAGWRMTKKELNKINEAERKSKKELQDLGLSESDAEILIKEPETPKEEKEGIIKALYTLVRKSSSAEHMLPTEYLDPQVFVEGLENVLFVTESQVKDKKTIDFVFRIPESAIIGGNREFDRTGKDRYQQRSPEIKDYIRCLNDATKEISDNIAKFSPMPRRKLSLFAAFTYRNESMSEPISDFIELDPSAYEEYAYTDDNGRERDGLTDFYKELVEGTVAEGFYEKLREALSEFSKEHDNASIVWRGVFPAYKISFDQINHRGIGVDLKQASKILRYYIDELIVEGDASRRKTYQIKYENVLFCSLSEADTPSYGWHYEVDSNGSVVSAPLPEFDFDDGEED